MHSNEIVNKLRLLITLPLIVLGTVVLIMVIQFSDTIKNLHDTQSRIQEIKTISHAMIELQKERGLSGWYLEDKSNVSYEALQKQRIKTDKELKKFHALYVNNKAINNLVKCEILRNKIDKSTIISSEQFAYYTTMIKKLFNHYITLVAKVTNNTITKDFASYTSLLVMQESLGKLRGSFNAIFSKKQFDAKLFYLALYAKGQYDISTQRYQTIAPYTFVKQLNDIYQREEYVWVHSRIEKYLTYEHLIPKEDPQEWFKKSTSIIRAFADLGSLHLKTIETTISEIYDDSVQKIILNSIMLFFLLAFMLLLGLKIKNSILEQISLLNQYKDIVDRSSIVSKTDIHGRITYVNDKFCEISGYTREELLGSPHNIIRHKDMSKSAFRDMWMTILDKKPWFGIVKNRKKDGDFYTVETSINPILDNDGKIIEFIALRNNITDVIKLHMEIEQSQVEFILRMGEINETRSQETGFHVKRVASYSEILAKYAGLSDFEVKNLTVASPMHDIGKVAIPDVILNKPSKLTPEEWKIMKTHAEIGYEIFKDSEKELLKTAAIIAYEHHEKYDGSGYPRGLRGENIHIFGRITALADIFDALGSERCYKKAWDDEKIFAYIHEERGKYFDPKLVDIFFAHLDEFLAVRDKYAEKVL